jgi:hypothetical protein
MNRAKDTFFASEGFDLPEVAQLLRLNDAKFWRKHCFTAGE